MNRTRRVTVNPEHAGQGSGGAVRLATRPGAKAEARQWNPLTPSAKVMMNVFEFHNKLCAPGASPFLSYRGMLSPFLRNQKGQSKHCLSEGVNHFV
jgi:hypothetical protein